MSCPPGKDDRAAPLREVRHSAEPPREPDVEPVAEQSKKTVDRKPGRGRLCGVYVVAAGHSKPPFQMIWAAAPRFVQRDQTRQPLLPAPPEPSGAIKVPTTKRRA